MPTVNGPDEITTLTGTADKVIYLNNSGDVTELALGAASTVLTSQGTTSAPTFSAPAAGGAWTLEGSITVEQTTTSTSDVVIATISGLNIPAGKPIMIIGQTRNSGGTATGTFFLGVNGTAIGNSSNAQYCYAGTMFSSGTSSASTSWIYFGPRGSDYTAQYNNAIGWTYRDNTYYECNRITTAAALPTAAITSIDIRGKTDNAAVAAVVGPTYVYSMAIS
jgi:hypothetical protein